MNKFNIYICNKKELKPTFPGNKKGWNKKRRNYNVSVCENYLSGVSEHKHNYNKSPSDSNLMCRLDIRNNRPHIDLCNDQPHKSLLEEVTELQKSNDWLVNQIGQLFK